ncbi:hypothetical protein J6590_039190 [Homalodisca vitripennis]|nr:hypothetical protein J6590_039190 [Homalodisca vitripennis]
MKKLAIVAVLVREWFTSSPRFYHFHIHQSSSRVRGPVLDRTSRVSEFRAFSWSEKGFKTEIQNFFGKFLR